MSEKFQCVACETVSDKNGKCPKCGQEMWPVVYSYSDAQALEDGVLVNPAGAVPCPFNRITRAVWDTFTSKFGGGLLTNVTKISALGKVMGEKHQNKEFSEGMIVIEFEGRTIWAMPNETTYSSFRPVKGWTIMFPDDY